MNCIWVVSSLKRYRKLLSDLEISEEFAVLDLEKFRQNSCVNESFFKRLSSSNACLFVRSSFFSLEFYFYLKSLTLLDGELHLIKLDSNQAQTKVGHYFGPYRDWLYNEIAQSRMSNLVLVLPNEFLKNEYEHWLNENILATCWSKNLSSTFDLILVPESMLEQVESFSKVYFHPKLKNLSWRMSGWPDQSFSQLKFYQLPRLNTGALFTYLFKFYRYKLL